MTHMSEANRMSDEAKLQNELDKKNGVIRLKPNLVPQAYPGLNRIGVTNSRPGRLGYASERWIACCVRRLRRLSNEPKSSKGGLSVIHLETSRHDMLLGDAFDLFPSRMLGRNFESKWRAIRCDHERCVYLINRRKLSHDGHSLL